MSSSSIDHRTEDGIEVYTLQAGSTKAEIVPAIGANCTSLYRPNISNLLLGDGLI